jgi:hypothetical protein
MLILPDACFTKKLLLYADNFFPSFDRGPFLLFKQVVLDAGVSSTHKEKFQSIRQSFSSFCFGLSSSKDRPQDLSLKNPF